MCLVYKKLNNKYNWYLFLDNSNKMDPLPVYLKRMDSLSDYLYEHGLYLRWPPNVEVLKLLTSLRPPPDWNRCFLHSFYNQNKLYCEWILSESKADIRILFDTTIDYILFNGGRIGYKSPISINKPFVMPNIRCHPIYYKPLKEHDKSHIEYLFDYITEQNMQISFIKWIVYLCVRNGAINNIPREILEIVQREETSLLFTISLIKYEFIENVLLDMNMLMIELPKYVIDL